MKPVSWDTVTTRAHRLAVYGSLAPGRSNAHQLHGLDGRWSAGSVTGWLLDTGWGAAIGYPALRLGDDGPVVDVMVFESADLPRHWARLDEFEGTEYERVEVTVHTPEGDLAAYLYAYRDR